MTLKVCATRPLRIYQIDRPYPLDLTVCVPARPLANPEHLAEGVTEMLKRFAQRECVSFWTLEEGEMSIAPHRIERVSFPGFWTFGDWTAVPDPGHGDSGETLSLE